MNQEKTEKRIYIGDCGCVRVESKHFRVSMQPEQFVEMLREIVREQKMFPSFSSRLKIANNVSDSSGFVTIQNKRRKIYE